MEKQETMKSKILKLLPKAVTFQNPPFSPGRDKHKININGGAKGFPSGAIISIIPPEAPRRSRSGNFDTQEPTSPKVSCIGQVKHMKKSTNKKMSINKSRRVGMVSPPQQESKLESSSPPEQVKKTLEIVKIFSYGATPLRKSDASLDKPQALNKAPSLGEMKRFRSGRATLVNFDWKQVVFEDRDHNNHEEEERDEESSDGEDDDAVVPHCAPIMEGERVAVVPRTEINLWKRRTMAQPMPLQLNNLQGRSS